MNSELGIAFQVNELGIKGGNGSESWGRQASKSEKRAIVCSVLPVECPLHAERSSVGVDVDEVGVHGHSILDAAVPTRIGIVGFQSENFRAWRVAFRHVDGVGELKKQEVSQCNHSSNVQNA